jgi:hypothetical protein
VVPLLAATASAFVPFGIKSVGLSQTSSSRVLHAEGRFPFFDSSSSSDGMEGNKQNQQQQQEETSMVDASAMLSSTDYFALEALSLGQVNAPLERHERLFQESETKKRFLFGNELLELRAKVTKMRERLNKAQRRGNAKDVEALRSRIRRLSLRDAEFVYGEMLDLADQAKRMGDKREEQLYREEAAAVRACLPHFNIEGLWVGKYGDHGYEMINVTYVGDTLIATKVTGDKNVPKNEVTFTADLRPSFHHGSDHALSPIELSSTASKQWGTKGLMRYPGKGQVAGEGYVNAKFMEGQLIMVGEEYFSFAWVPIGYQIFFGRPSAELTLKMLKKSEERAVAKGRVALQNGDVDGMRRYAVKCLEATDLCWVEDETEEDTPFFEDESLHFQ